jgi:hypothetical protein
MTVSKVLAALIGGAVLLVSERQKRRHAQELRRFERLAPQLRSLIGVGEDLSQIARGLVHRPGDTVRSRETGHIQVRRVEKLGRWRSRAGNGVSKRGTASRSR